MRDGPIYAVPDPPGHHSRRAHARHVCDPTATPAAVDPRPVDPEDRVPREQERGLPRTVIDRRDSDGASIERVVDTYSGHPRDAHGVEAAAPRSPHLNDVARLWPQLEAVAAMGASVLPLNVHHQTRLLAQDASTQRQPPEDTAHTSDGGRATGHLAGPHGDK